MLYQNSSCDLAFCDMKASRSHIFLLSPNSRCSALIWQPLLAARKRPIGLEQRFNVEQMEQAQTNKH